MLKWTKLCYEFCLSYAHFVYFVHLHSQYRDVWLYIFFFINKNKELGISTYSDWKQNYMQITVIYVHSIWIGIIFKNSRDMQVVDPRYNSLFE